VRHRNDKSDRCGCGCGNTKSETALLPRRPARQGRLGRPDGESGSCLRLVSKFIAVDRCFCVGSRRIASSRFVSSVLTHADALFVVVGAAAGPPTSAIERQPSQ
jgi:hypothetical protein